LLPVKSYAWSRAQADDRRADTQLEQSLGRGSVYLWLAKVDEAREWTDVLINEWIDLLITLDAGLVIR
jgi:hypothetical protein